MKILYIIHSCVMGGATISFLQLVRKIKERGCDVVIVFPNEKERSVIKEFSNIGCKCIGVSSVPCSWIFTKTMKSKIMIPLTIIYLFMVKLKFYIELKNIICKEKPDIIHTNTGVVHEAFNLAFKLKIPHVWHLREYQLKDFNCRPFPSLFFFKKLLRKSYTVCITKDIQKYFDLNNCSNSFVIYNPVMSEKFNLKRNMNLETPFFLVANRISKEKGIEDIISAFSLFSKKVFSYKLKICGFGNESYVSYLKQLCCKKNVQDSVEFLGYTDSSHIYKFMSESKALIVASYNEGFGRMTAEANMLGIPVLGRDSAGTKEVLDLTLGGLKFISVEELAENMRKIASMNFNQLSDFMINPTKIAKKIFSTEQHVNKIYDLYSKLNKKSNNK